MSDLTKQLALAVQEWHTNKRAALQVVLDAPDDADLVFQCADGEQITIKGGTDKAKGFRIGVIIALEQFGKLPFTFTEQDG